MKKCCLMLLALLAVLATASCGGSNAGLALPPAGIDQPGTEVPADAMEGLPGLNELYEAGHAVSAAENGWYDLNLAQTALVDNSSGVSLGQDGLSFDAATGSAWQLWGVRGFSGAQKPATFRTEVSSVQGEYYICVADFKLGRWSFSGPFSSSTELEHDDTLGNPPLSNLVKDDETHWVAILMTEGSSMLLQGAAIGLTGDGTAPAVNQMFLNSGPDYVQVNWNPSADQNEMDFAGYSVERAPLVDGDFETLHPELLHGMSYVDSGLQPGDLFRYRVRVHDLSGQSSVTAPQSAGPDAGGNGQPVVVVDMPAGPLSAPAGITIDLSASFDPDGDAITSYGVSFGSGMEPIVQADPVFNVTLQPGCYNVFCSADDGNTPGYALRQLKVYPKWQEQSTEVIGKSQKARRYTTLNAGNSPADGSLCTLRYDVASDNLVLRREDASGLQEFVLRGETEEILHVARPAAYKGGLVFPVVGREKQLRFAYWSGQELSMLDVDPLPGISSTSVFVFVGLNDRLLVVKADGPDHDIVAWDIITGAQFTLASQTWGEFCFTANPVLDCYEFVSSDLQGLHWQRLDADLQVIDSAELGNGSIAGGSIQADPDTGDVYCFGDFVANEEMISLPADAADWSEPSSFNVSLSYDFTPEIFFLDGHLMVPAKDNGISILLFEVLDGQLSQHGVLQEESFNDLFQFTYSTTDEMFRFYDSYSFFGQRDLVYDVDVQGGLHELDPILYTGNYGKQLQAVAADGYMYVGYYRNDYSKYVFTSDAVNFSDPIDCGYYGSLRLYSSGDNAYMSIAEQFDVELYKMSGGGRHSLHSTGMFGVRSQPVSSVGPRALLLCDGSDGDTVLNGADGWDVPFTADTDLQNVWRGAIASNNDWSGIFLSGGDDIYEAETVSLLDGTSGQSELLFPATQRMRRVDFQDGRRFAASSFRDNSTLQHKVFYSADSPSGQAQRIVLEDSVPVPEDVTLDAQDPRRTVSAALGRGDTCVAVLADNQGDDVHLEWDDFGSFEKLHVPDMGWSNMHVITVGSDGRWHLVYHDQATDTIRIWSTVK